jgi:DNA-binding MarR family transcriptional regulator
MDGSIIRGAGNQKQNLIFRNIAQEVYLSLVISSSQLSYDVDILMRKHGLTQPQYNVLRILRGAGQDGLGRNEIRERLVTSMPDVTRLLDRMEVAGLISRRQCEVDRRQMRTTLTARGTKLVRKLDAPLDNLHHEHVAGIQESELKTMLTVLSKLRANTESK